MLKRGLGPAAMGVAVLLAFAPDTGAAAGRPASALRLHSQSPSVLVFVKKDGEGKEGKEKGKAGKGGADISDTLDTVRETIDRAVGHGPGRGGSGSSSGGNAGAGGGTSDPGGGGTADPPAIDRGRPGSLERVAQEAEFRISRGDEEGALRLPPGPLFWWQLTQAPSHDRRDWTWVDAPITGEPASPAALYPVDADQEASALRLKWR